MIIRRIFSVAVIITFSFSVFAQTKTTVNSPNNNIRLEFWLGRQGDPYYAVFYKNRKVVLPSKLGFEIREHFQDKKVTSLQNNFEQLSAAPFTYNGSWKPVWGEVKEIKENYNAVTVSLSQKPAGPFYSI